VSQASSHPSPIPFHDLKRQHEALLPALRGALDRVLASGAFAGGPFVESFEARFAAHAGTRFAVGLNSGTSALHLALVALGVGAGDEVIVPANTFIATAWAPSYVGARPVFVDCTPGGWNLDPERVSAAVTPRTRAIVGVHLYGQPFEVDAVRAVAERHGIPLVEDCAQAHGARWKGARAGSLGRIGCFSHYPSKNLGACGEGGTVTTDDADLAARIRALRNHGSIERYRHDEIGFNMRMDGFQGAILELKLAHLDAWNERRRAIAARYRREIDNPRVRFQSGSPAAEAVHHLFVVAVPDREAFVRHLEARGVLTAVHYPIPCHLQKAYAGLGHRPGDFPNAERLARECVSLPMFPELTDDEVARVIEAVRSAP
jgi:dTDP-4-amino-4,6-dideoxygalactose transaminase